MGFPHLLLITERFPPDLGGVARSAARIAVALAELGADVDVLAWTKTLPAGELESLSWRPSPERGSALGAASAIGRTTIHRLGLFANLDFSLQYTMNVLDWLHGQNPFAAVWGHYLSPAGFMAVVTAESHGIGSTVSARGNDVDRMMFPPGDFARLLWTLERASVITTVSRDLARKIDLLMGRDAKVEVVANAVDPDIFHPGSPDPSLRNELGIGAEESVLGFCGELRQKKGLPFLLRALSEVRRVRPACLLVIGDVRPREQASLATYAAEQPDCAARVIVTGRLEEPARVAEHLRLCDAFLQPSIWDGLPNAVLEAMASGLVVIASDAGGIPEAVEDRRSGFLLPRANLERLGEAVLEVLQLPPARRANIGAAARERVRSAFHPSNEAAALRQVLTRLVPSISS